MGWGVVESRTIARQIVRAPVDIQRKYVIWRELVQQTGPNLGGGYRTHSLRGKCKGQKAARLTRQWRVIFRVVSTELIVEALELVPHRY